MRNRTGSLKKRNYEERKDQVTSRNQHRQQAAEDKPNSHSSLRISATAGNLPPQAIHPHLWQNGRYDNAHRTDLSLLRFPVQDGYENCTIARATHAQYTSRQMGRKNCRVDQAQRHSLGGRLAGGVRQALPGNGGQRHLHQAERRPVAGLLPGPLRRQRRGPGGRPHLHLLAVEGQRRPHQQLGKSLHDAPQVEGALQRLPCRDAPCTCCPSAWARWARRCRRSACSSPIRLTWS